MLNCVFLISAEFIWSPASLKGLKDEYKKVEEDRRMEEERRYERRDRNERGTWLGEKTQVRERTHQERKRA